MVEKLRLASRQIPWSLVLRAAVFAIAWLYLPFWLFLLIVLYLYLSPLFQPLKLALPFLLLLFFTAAEPATVWRAVFFAVLFALILGIKDLIFIERKSAYEILILLLLFPLYIIFFSHFDSWQGFSPFASSLLISLVFFFLCRGFLRYGKDPSFDNIPRAASVAVGITSLMVWQLALAMLFLPISFLYQSAIAFLATVLLLEAIFHYIERSLVRERILLHFSVFFIFLVIILGSAHWGLQ